MRWLNILFFLSRCRNEYFSLLWLEPTPLLRNHYLIFVDSLLNQINSVNEASLAIFQNLFFHNFPKCRGYEIRSVRYLKYLFWCRFFIYRYSLKSHWPVLKSSMPNNKDCWLYQCTVRSKIPAKRERGYIVAGSRERQREVKTRRYFIEWPWSDHIWK